MEQHHLTHLEKQLRELHTGFQNFSGGDSVDGLIPIIHRPGWTTPAEVAFFTGIVDSMVTHTRALSALKQALLSGASMVAAGRGGNRVFFQGGIESSARTAKQGKERVTRSRTESSAAAAKIGRLQQATYLMGEEAASGGRCLPMAATLQATNPRTTTPGTPHPGEKCVMSSDAETSANSLS